MTTDDIESIVIKLIDDIDIPRLVRLLVRAELLAVRAEERERRLRIDVDTRTNDPLRGMLRALRGEPEEGDE